MTNDDSSLAETLAITPAFSLGQLVRYFLQFGAIGLGGPVPLMGYMHRDLVERRKWIAKAEYKEGLTLAQPMPGPLAAQLVKIAYGSAIV